jgi:hypothetical protein
MIVQTRLLAISIPNKDLMIGKEMATNLRRLKSKNRGLYFKIDMTLFPPLQAEISP